jgi:hypothetical protein
MAGVRVQGHDDATGPEAMTFLGSRWSAKVFYHSTGYPFYMFMPPMYEIPSFSSMPILMFEQFEVRRVPKASDMPALNALPGSRLAPCTLHALRGNLDRGQLRPSDWDRGVFLKDLLSKAPGLDQVP